MSAHPNDGGPAVDFEVCPAGTLAEIERLRARVAELERESDLRMPHGWRAKKENGQWRLEQWRGSEWIRATWIDSNVVSKFIDDMAAAALTKDATP